MPHNNSLNSLRKNLTTHLITLMVLILTITSFHANAFTGAGNEPIKIQSDRAELDEHKGRSIYSGDVVITQGTSILTSDKVIIYNDKNGLIKLEAFGSPAKFTEQQETDPQPTHAYGNTIIYTRADEKLTLIEDAKLEQGKNTFRGKKIEYNTVTRIVTAEGGKEQSQRVEIIVHPVKKDTGETNE